MVLLGFRRTGNLEETTRLPGLSGGLVETSEAWSDITSDHGVRDIYWGWVFANSV